MSFNKPKRPTHPITIPGIGDVMARGLLFTERETVVLEFGGAGNRMSFVLQILHRTIVDPETSEPIMTIEEWNEAAAADVDAAMDAFREGLKLSGLSTDDAPGDDLPKD
jgi:hypothetical protein